MNLGITHEILITGIAIFLLRIVDMSMDTLRVLFVVRGKKLIVWILGIMQSAIFIVAISNVLKGENHWFTILGYAVGFATGNIIGMSIEERLAIGFQRITIISRTKGIEIAAAIRDAGFGVTEMPARGKDGDVAFININAKRKQVPDVEKIALGLDENAFITVDDFKTVNHSGYWRK